MVSLVRLQRELFLWLQLVRLHLLHLGGKDSFGLRRRVNAGGLDRDDKVTAVLQEVLGIQRHNTALIRLGNVGENRVYHANQHAVLVRMASVLDDGDDVGPLLGHIDQIAAGTVRELHGVDKAFGTHNVGHMGDCGSGSTAQIQDLGARWHVNLLNAAQNGSSQLGAEGIPHTVLNLLAIGL